MAKLGDKDIWGEDIRRKSLDDSPNKYGDSKIDDIIRDRLRNQISPKAQQTLDNAAKYPHKIYELQLTPEEWDEFSKALVELLDAPVQSKPAYYPTPIKTPKSPADFINHNLNIPTERNVSMSSKINGWITEPDGTRKCFKDGKLHADDGPAEIRTNGTYLYYKIGKLHRDGNLPAMVGINGTEKYAVNGEYHRVGGDPAIIWSKSTYRQEWWTNGQIQKAIRKDGTIEHFAPGETDRDDAVRYKRFHREDGPAVIYPNGFQEYWLNGTQFRTRAQWEAALLHPTSIVDPAINERLHEDNIDSYLNEEIPETVKTNNPTNKTVTETKKMNNKPEFGELLKQNMVSAGYRVAGTQLTTLVKNSIVTVMRNKGADGGQLQAVSTFLDSEFGAALIGCLLGFGLNYVPHVGDDVRVQRLAEELRVGGMAVAGNALVGEALQHVLPAMSQILNNLPSPETSSNVRIEESKETTKESKIAEALEEETVEASNVKTMLA